MLVTANLYYSDVTAMPQKLMFQGTIQVNTNVAYYLVQQSERKYKALDL